MALTTSSHAKALWPGIRAWYDDLYGPERLDTALKEDDLVARVAAMMLYLEHGHPYGYKEETEKAIDDMVSDVNTSSCQPTEEQLMAAYLDLFDKEDT